MTELYRAKPSDGVAWVTGASSGIGRGTALELARRGYTVIATARRLAELEALVAESAGVAGRVIAAIGDVTDGHGVFALVDQIEQNYGPIILAFLNAGIYFPLRAQPFDAEGFRKTFDVNVYGTINGLAALLPRMVARKSGQIALNASVAGYGGLPRAAAYSGSKAALIAMAESLKFDTDLLGITLQIVNPGFVETPLTALNDHPMPFLMKLDEASRCICNGFETAGFEITFPKRLAYILKALNMLPYSIYFGLIAKITGWTGKSD
jgi:NAD(P)-dependent dehydrogenase (short-subunit alcohol dehydrogenase family)